MRKEKGLDALTEYCDRRLTASTLSTLLREDLSECYCSIFGRDNNEESTLLAILSIIPESLEYEQFDQRIDFVVSGVIQVDAYVPLTYRVQGKYYEFYGRCSTTPKVCGVDLYLSKSYTEKAGDMARQRFSVSVKKLLKVHL
ncbi:MAG: hypothetical protein KAG19_04390 [Methylococcales bacterium]|nr:hypothetical protein [Methylococcales bacterium]